MDKALVILYFLFALVMSVIDFPDSAVAVLFTTLLTGAVIFLIRHSSKEEAPLLTRIFIIALLLRLFFGMFLHLADLRDFFGGDANTYDFMGNRLVEVWYGQAELTDFYTQRALNATSGWGMNYLVAGIYLFVGQNILAAQSFCALIGAATAPLIYKCSFEIFGNRRISKVSALLVGFYPAFIVWTGQLLKDGIVIFLLVLAITTILQLQKKFTYLNITLLGFSLFGIFAIRFYIFYMVVAAVVGGFVVGFTSSTRAVINRVTILFFIGLGLTFFGVMNKAGSDIDEFANLKRIQESRLDLSAQGSGFGKDIDVSTTEGALTVLPIGFVYLLLAPFPWQADNLRQAITIPEVMIWWAALPILILGFWYTIKHRLRAALSMLIFTFMLTVAYSLFQGNVGTAYRQRTQIQVFMFIFIAVGWTYIQEKRENREILRLEQHRRQMKRLRTTA